jgi:hypothetical protein
MAEHVKKTNRKILLLMLLVDALLITAPVVVSEVLTVYYKHNGLPVPSQWWFVPVSMGLGLLLLLGLIVWDVVTRFRAYRARRGEKNRSAQKHTQR